MRLLFLFSTLIICFQIQAQKTKTLKLKSFKTVTLDHKLTETSGLCFYNNKLYSFNDGGNPSTIYELNNDTGEILKTFNTSIPNKDWEAITSDASFLYLGDFGNNLGTRKDLTIYQLQLKNDSIKLIQKIPFEFIDQTYFTSQNLKHNFDVESMIAIENQLHIFTKEWKSKGTSHYIIQTDSKEKQKLIPTEFLKTKFLLTDAFYHDNQLYCIGYTKKGRCFLQIFNKNENGFFFKVPSTKFRLGSVLAIGQIEGIAVNQDGIYISSEGFSKSIFKVKPTLYFLPFSALKE